MLNPHGYFPPEANLWTGRVDATIPLRLHEAVHCIDIQSSFLFPEKSIAFIGFACDEGVQRNHGRPGAVEGPAAWRKALANMPLPEYLQRPLVDLGDIVCLNNDLESAQESLGELTAWVLKNGGFPIVCGGGHEVAWGHFQGISKAGFDKNISIINLDAHYDLRPLQEGKGNSGTSFTQIAQHQNTNKHPFHYACVGIQPLSNTSALHAEALAHKVLIVTADEIDKAVEKMAPLIEQTNDLFLTICLDVFAAAYAAGVSAPQPLGIIPSQAIPLIKKIARSGKLRTCNFAELCPPHDLDGNTARLTAFLTLEIIKELSW